MKQKDKRPLPQDRPAPRKAHAASAITVPLSNDQQALLAQYCAITEGEIADVHGEVAEGLAAQLDELLTPIRRKVDLFNAKLAELKTQIATGRIEAPATGVPYDASASRANGSAHA